MIIHCTRCDKSKPSTEFYKNAARANGYDNYCRECKHELGRERDRARRGQPVPEAFQCAIKGCADRQKGMGFCNRHLKRYRVYGNPLAGRSYKTDTKRPKRPAGLTLEESFRWFMPGEPPATQAPWMWRGPVDGKGYGTIRYQGRNVLAHRVSYELFVGPIPEGMIVRHKNDTPLDVNPSNLELGTLIDNVQDREERGRTYRGKRKEKSPTRSAAMQERAARGESHARARFVEADIVAIREAFAAGEKQQVLADRYGTSKTAISLIVNRKTWKHVP